MKVFEHWVDITRIISILYWRVCYEVVQAGFNFNSLLFSYAIHCASRIFRSYGPIQRTDTDAARATISSRAAATRRSDRSVPGRASGADSRGLDVPGCDCRGGPGDANAFQR